MKRFFTAQPLGADIVLKDMEHNHLASVLRCRVGDEVVIMCGDEFDYSYEIVTITKSSSTLRFSRKQENTANPTAHLTVFLALIKFDALALAVQKLNEIGASEVIFFNSSYCNIAPKSVNIQKLQTIANQSCKQCGRSIPLKVGGILSFEQMTALLSSFDKAFFADEARANTESISQVNCSPELSRVCVIIGCEGGFNETERIELRKNSTPVSLGRRILRAETAAITASTILLAKMGEL